MAQATTADIQTAQNGTWGGVAGFFDGAIDLAGKIGKTYNDITGKNQTQTAQVQNSQASTPATEKPSKNYTSYIIGGAAVLLVIIILVMRK